MEIVRSYAMGVTRITWIGIERAHSSSKTTLSFLCEISYIPLADVVREQFGVGLEHRRPQGFRLRITNKTIDLSACKFVE